MVDFILRPEPGVEKKVLDIGWYPCCYASSASLNFASFQGVEVVFGKHFSVRHLKI